jgi:riboflavin synthase
MFTGIITDLGRVVDVVPGGGSRLTIETAYDTNSIELGASISCSGACLTVVDRGENWFAVDVSNETLSATTIGDWTLGTEVNLERALRFGDELGGHLVSGHVDAVATIADRRDDGDSVRLTVEVPESLGRYVAPKGSVALDGVSLTVNEVADARFGVNIIPHTLSCTTLRNLKPGHRVNFEADLLARYVVRALGRA